MSRFRNLKTLVLLFAFVVLFAGGFTIMSAGEAAASYPCCIWAMICPVFDPGPCWCVCIPVPCEPPLPPPLP